ncbi:uncharacterized protein LOC143283340 [Babylonia areolata]|uniref:uncharacterized protein LOC143283340 n=1 Tax=Babylonia areolata TaxID=304850 RepID=UPI003FD40994
MFISLAYVSLALIQLYRRCQRRFQYSAAMLRALRSGSILVQRGNRAQHGSVGALLNSSLLSCSRSYKETMLLSDEYLAVSTVSPKQQVDLGEWTSYLDLHPVQNSSNSVVALLEAGPPDVSEMAQSMQVAPASRVHVLKHGCPLAWKSGNPFGIILHCSYEDFVILCDAFGQGHLTLNEDLQLHRMLTISTVGKPKSLRRPQSEVVPATVDVRDNQKSRRANTDPARLLSSAAGNHPACVPATPGSSGDAMKIDGTGFESTSPAKPKVGSDHCFVGQKESLHTEKSVDKENGSSDNLAAGPSDLTRNGSAVRVEEKMTAVLEESPVIQVSADFVKGLEKNTSVASTDTHDRFESQSADSNDTNSLQEKHLKESSVPLMTDSIDAVSNDVCAVHGLNGCGDHSEKSIKKSSLPMTDSHQESTLKQSSTERKDDVKMPPSNQAVSFLKQDLNISSTVPAETDTESSSIFAEYQQALNKPKDAIISAASVNGSAHSVNGNNGATISEKNSKPLNKETKAEGSEFGSHEASHSSEGEGEKTMQSTSSPSSRNGTHDTNGRGGGQTGCKPPNVVVYCGKKDSARKFDMIKEGLEQCLNISAYTIYILPHEEVMSLPWEDNSATLIISHDYLHDNIGKKFASFLMNGGKVLSFGSSMEAEFLVRKEVKGRPAITKFNLQKWRDVSAIQGRHHYIPGSLKKGNSSMDTLVVDPASGQPLVVRLTLSSEHGNGTAIFSQLFLERDPSEMAADSKTFSRLKQSSKQRLEVLRYLLSLLDLDTSLSPPCPPTPCYILVQDQALRKSFLDSIAGRMKQGVIRSRTLSLRFVTSKSESLSALTATADTLPVVTDIPAGSVKEMRDAGSLQFFNPEVYWRHLSTSVMGRVVMYTEVIPTTMTVFEGIQFSLPEDIGVICVAGRQTSGKGRGGNQWLSPLGCAMFSLPLRLAVDSCLGQHITFLQHVVSLAVVHSIRSLPGYQDLDLRLKWPNDIYFGNKTKLGGVLVNSTMMGNTMHATVGCGVNVSNNQPTVCINSIIQDYNQAHGSSLKPLTTSEVLAHIVSALETLVAQFQEKGHQDFCQLYYKYWLHSGARVKVESEGNAEVEIIGLDDYGFLHAVNQQGQNLSVQPDGNSFDMLHNLISVKRD